MLRRLIGWLLGWWIGSLANEMSVKLDLTALNLIRSIACERLSQDSTLERSEGDPVASSCLHRLMPQLSSDFTARSDLNTFRRLATDVKHRVSREPVYGGFGARVYPQASPEESELAVTSNAVGWAADFGEGRVRGACIRAYGHTSFI